jgi:transcriptional regulator with XRE-family HTH domain
MEVTIGALFGNIVKKKRVENRFTLREFCILIGEDASNWSKIERGKLTPPQTEKKLEKIANILKISKASEEFNDLVSAASVDAGKIPYYLMSDKDVINALPVFFRTIGSVKPTPEEFGKLIEKIRQEG